MVKYNLKNSISKVTGKLPSGHLSGSLEVGVMERYGYAVIAKNRNMPLSF